MTKKRVMGAWMKRVSRGRWRGEEGWERRVSWIDSLWHVR